LASIPTGFGRARSRKKAQDFLSDYPSLHPALAVSYNSTVCHRIADTLLIDGTAADKTWTHITSMIHHLSADTNWRVEPSILD
jgi:hypothetical protein